MSLLIIFLVSFLGILLGKLLFKKWFNHLTLYCLIFGGSLFLYELKLLPYVDIIPLAWFVMITSFLSFSMGVLTIISARNLSKRKLIFDKKSDISLKIFLDDGKTLKYVIIILSLISLYSTIEFWNILIKQFGSIPAVLVNGQVIYRLNIEGELKGTTPYISLLGFVAVFFVGIYTAYKGKFTLLTFIPLISIVLREVAAAGRVGMSIALMEFTFSFLLFRYLLNNDIHSRFKFSNVNAIVASLVLIAVFIAGASLVRISRVTNSSENISGASRGLRQMKENLIISPSVYLYASGSIGVLSKYLGSEGENTMFGQNTFQTAYLFLAKLDVIKKPSVYPRGYFIPMWTNSATYLRALHADFGITGVLLFPFIIGLLTTWLWFRFYERNSIIVFAFLVYFYLIVGFSFLVIVTRFYYWTVDLAIILILTPVIEKIATRNYNTKKYKYQSLLVK